MFHAIFEHYSNCDRPRVVEALRGKDIVDIACGGAHSAALTARGELYSWGKGRYGRLGHGDGEDQLRPKLVSLQVFELDQLVCVVCFHVLRALCTGISLG